MNNTEALDTLLDELKTSFLQTTDITSDEDKIIHTGSGKERHFKHISEAKAKIQQYVDSECVKARRDELTNLCHQTYKLPNGFYGVSSKEIAGRISELNTEGIQDE